MKRFRFRLQNLLRIREYREMEKKQAFADALRKISKVENRVNTMQNILVEERRMMADKSTGKVDLSYMIQHENFTYGMGARIQDAEDSLVPLYEEKERRRKGLVQATRDKRVLEELKKRKEVAYMKEMEHREAIELDEIGIQMFQPARKKDQD